jgi:hypothetical protein
MRKLILITALLAASTAFAQAGESRSLSLTGVAVTEPAKPIAQVSMQLAQAATAPAETSAPVQAQAPAPAQTQAPAATTEPKAETKTTETKTTETKTTETKPSKPVKKVNRESDEHKARRIAAKYGVYW